MLRTSTHIHSSRELEILDSLEIQEPFSRDSEFQTGLKMTEEKDGKLMPTQDKLGTMLCTISWVKQLQCTSSVKDKSQTLLSGSEVSKLEMETQLDYSITKCHTQPGSDTKDILTTQRILSTLSLTPTRTNKLCSVSTPPLKREELLSRLNLMPSLSSPQNSSRRI